jgi:hypothetical protein
MDKLKNGHYYNIEFVGKYKEKGPYFVEISGTTSKDTADIYGDYDIRGTFFPDDGILTFLKMYSADTVLFIGHTITKTDPLEVDISDNILIPESIIDYTATEEWVLTTKFTFNIGGITRKFDSLLERADFVNTVNSNIVDYLHDTDEFIADVMTLEDSNKEILMPVSANLKFEKERERLLTLKRTTILHQREAQEATRLKLVDIQKDLENREALLAHNIAVYNAQINELTDIIYKNEAFNRASVRMKATLYLIWQELNQFAQENIIPIKSFDDIWNDAYKKAGETPESVPEFNTPEEPEPIEEPEEPTP